MCCLWSRNDASNSLSRLICICICICIFICICICVCISHIVHCTSVRRACDGEMMTPNLWSCQSISRTFLSQLSLVILTLPMFPRDNERMAGLHSWSDRRTKFRHSVHCPKIPKTSAYPIWANFYQIKSYLIFDLGNWLVFGRTKWTWPSQAILSDLV